MLAMAHIERMTNQIQKFLVSSEFDLYRQFSIGVCSVLMLDIWKLEC